MRLGRLILGAAAGAGALAACSINISGNGEIGAFDASTPNDAISPNADTGAPDDAPATQTDSSAGDDGAMDAADAGDADIGVTDGAAEASADSGSDAADANDGAPVLNCDGGACYALKFDSADEFNAGGAVLTTTVPVEGDFTLEAFVQSTEPFDTGNDVHTGNMVFAAYQTSVMDSKNDYWVQFFNGGIFSAVIGSGSGASAGSKHVDGTTTLSPNQWIHVAVTRQGSNVNSYINGNVTAYASSSSCNSVTLSDVSAFAVGQNFVGMIDDVRVWNNVRSPTQINQDSTAVNVATGNGLVLYWKFDDGPGSTTAADSSGSNNAGSLSTTNTPQWVISTR